MNTFCLFHISPIEKSITKSQNDLHQFLPKKPFLDNMVTIVMSRFSKMIQMLNRLVFMPV